MRVITVCAKCGSKEIEYLGGDKCYCRNCESEQDSKDKVIESPYERTRRAVYATGNKWAIENFNATH
jgi:NADH pyrophosphatase NudC (nudix superfamily)